MEQVKQLLLSEVQFKKKKEEKLQLSVAVFRIQRES